MSINNSDILMYQTEDGITKIEVRMEQETVWLSQAQMADLFQTSTQNITMHLKNIYEEAELIEETTCKEYLQVREEGSRTVRRKTKFYNLDAIISVGYRVKSHRGTQFRIWATQRLKEYIIKGFTMNDDLLKNAGGGNYFDELLSRIRDIRSSEKVFYRKILDIYATSIDYDATTKATQTFFKTVQNKMHFSAHGKTAAEIIFERADSEKPYMGLLSWAGDEPKKADAESAKNYLTEDELDTLNRIVNMYLDFAELQAKERRPMYMQDWIQKLDDFMKLSGREILTHAGKISHEIAKEKADLEFKKYKDASKNSISRVERDFISSIDKVSKKLGSKSKK